MDSISVDGVFDIETESWDIFVLGGLLTRDGYREFRDPDAMVDAMLDIPGDLWAHNGGRFDALWLLEVLRRRGIRAGVSLAGSRVTRVQVGRTTVRDSYALIPMSLAKAAPIAGARKTSAGLPCRCGRACGGYCSVRRDMTPDEYSRLSEYLENDCRVTLAVLDAVSDFAEAHGFAVRGTVGGTAWHSARTLAGIEDAEWRSVGLYKLARRGYFGGRTQVFRPRAAAGWRYDIHSSYPAALARTPVPSGEPRLVVGADASAAYTRGDEGIFAASVAVRSDEWIPPLPLRHSDRLWYPVGSFAGEWTALELRHAELHGATIERISHGLAWPSRSLALAPWCERVWSWRAEAAESNPALARWIKWLANSLTGKLAMRPDIRAVVVSPDNPRACDGALHSCDGEHHPAAHCCEHRCIGRCGRWELVGPSRRVWSRSVYRLPSCGHVHAAAYLTASARVELHAQLLHAGDAAVYCDTDSVYSTRELSRRIGGDLGEWGMEGEMRDWYAVAPKLYRYKDGAAGWRVRAKGIPRATAEDLDVLAAGGTVERDGGVAGLLSAARAGGSLFKTRTISRRSHADGIHVGDREIRGDITFPLDSMNIPVV